MRILSPILNRVIYPFLGASGYFHGGAGQLSALTYHGVIPEEYHPRDCLLDGHLHRAEDFRDELRLLKRRYSIVSPQQVLGWLEGNSVLPKSAVLLTCDDGLLNTVTDMLPILKDEQVECLFFVTGDFMSGEPRMLWCEELYLMLMDSQVRQFQLCLEPDQFTFALSSTEDRRTVWWDLVKKLSGMDARQRATSMAQARSELELETIWRSRYLDDPILRRRFALVSDSDLHQLVQAGMSIGAHSLSHPLLTRQTPEMARMELEQSGRALESALGSPVWALAYPFGGPDAVGEREFQIAESAGYRCAFVNYGGAVRRGSRHFALPRIHIPGDTKLAAFEAHASGFHWALRNRFKRNGNVVSAER
jgi:peptidoglycan/xylan/chitin deacetylase (PgdA/CDA1 family)